MGVILTACHWWIVVLWVIFVVYWAVAAISARRGLKRSAFRGSMKLRLILMVVIVAAVVLTRHSPALHALQFSLFWSLPMAFAGAVIATLGAVLAFTARAAIGRNWGTPGMQRTDTDLITRGPYALVRHPIYSGILLMMVGTAIGLIAAWWLAAAAAAVYFVYSARAEERYMCERFPDAYPTYRARTKMLVPFLF
ncbi:MAG TPA: isoprenylcysteine carboxylmethyltransferase family protein [Sphingomicrobium sp.]|nr:isoprenylcysteine carboxylmethyltransferase family protein [Sphingomicrobium sp.]